MVLLIRGAGNDINMCMLKFHVLLHGRYKFFIKTLEEFVLEHSLCRYTMDWIISEHLIQQVIASAVDDLHLFT